MAHGDWVIIGQHMANGDGVVLDRLLAFPGGNGTADMRQRCEIAGVPIEDHGGG
jgi:hypothetical protein